MQDWLSESASSPITIYASHNCGDVASECRLGANIPMVSDAVSSTYDDVVMKPVYWRRFIV
jgi:hypothetical protein